MKFIDILLIARQWKSVELVRAQGFAAATALLLGLLAVFPLIPLWAQTEPTQASEGWEETPYLWAGKTLEELKPSIAENVVPVYGELRFLYPSADACLMSPSGEEPDVQGRDLIWYELDTKEAVEVCLFRVFTALGDQAKIEIWLENKGFGSRFESDKTRSGFLFGIEGERITLLSMTWRTSEQGALFGVTEKQRRKQVRRVLHRTVSIIITETGRVLSVRLTGASAIWRK